MAYGKKTGGRQKGTPNKTTAEIKELAQAHGAAAIRRLVQLMNKASSEQTQVAAAKELLDRGYGKATQPIAGDPDMPPVGLLPVMVELVAPDVKGKD